MTEDIAARVVSRHRRSPRRQQPRAGRRGTQLARRGGTALAVIATLTCGITTLLLASGLVAAGGGLLGSGELAVLAAVVPVTVLIWRATVRRRRRCAHAPYPAGQRTTKEASP